MTDDATAAVERLKAELRALQARYAASQAALATAECEKAALADELARRDRALAEAHEQQAATAEVLSLIASSPTDSKQVLEAIAESAARLCDAGGSTIWRRYGDRVVPAHNHGGTARHLDETNREQYHRELREALGDPSLPDDWRFEDGVPLTRRIVSVRACLDGATIHIVDLRTADDFPGSQVFARLLGQRSTLAVPMLSHGQPIGAIAVNRFEVRPFSDQEIALLETFADQAVIAIENARLFSELEQRNRDLSEALERQTAMADILRVIAASPADIQTVLSTINESAARLCDSNGATLALVEGNMRREVAAFGVRTPSVGLARPIERQDVAGRALRGRCTVHVHDLAAVWKAEFPDSAFTNHGHRTLLATPLMRSGAPIGVLLVTRKEARGYSEDQIRLVEAFADQAVVAIENARLFEELQEANRQLAEASRHKSQFLANMSHELRTPLNAIIGYSEMLQEEAEDTNADAFLPDLQRINAAGKHLLGLINDILDLSKIEAGRMDLYLETFEIRRMIQDVQAIVQPLVEKNGNTLVVECPEDIGTMHADLTKVRQTLFNLLSNAAKFTDHGTIELRVARDEAGSSSLVPRPSSLSRSRTPASG